MLKSYTPKVGASFTRNEQYWGTKALPAATQFTFYDTQTPEILALTGGTIDVVGQFSVTGGEQLLSGAYNVIKLKSSAHRELSMRCDQAPFTDPRVRQAIALTLNRPGDRQGAVQGLRRRRQRQPVRPGLPVDRHQRRRSAPQNIAKAKSLLAAAGHPSGFSTQLITETFLEIPQYAQIVAQAAKAIGVTISSRSRPRPPTTARPRSGTPTGWTRTMSLVDYGHRSVPNVFLTAPLQTTNAKTGTGPWNAAHFNNSQYDKLSKQYIATST